MFSLDTETTGIDFHHGAKPYFVTTCNDQGELIWFEWDVDPMTREPQIPQEDLRVLRGLIGNDAADDDETTYVPVILQNAKFDVKALETLGITNWPWNRTHDTLIAGHLLASNQPHDLTSMALHYLGWDIEPLEEALHQACEECRRWCRSHKPEWRIAKQGLQDMPSAKEKCWKLDGWLPRAVAKERNLEPSHHYWTVLSNYANADSSTTTTLWKVMKNKMECEGLWPIYLERMKTVRVAYLMEKRGVTISKTRLEQQQQEYAEESLRLKNVCENIALGFGFELELPKSGSSQQLSKFCFDPNGLNLPAVKRSKKTGVPSLDKDSLEQYESLLDERTKQHLFIQSLRKKRNYDTALLYMSGYSRFWHPYECHDGYEQSFGGTRNGVGVKAQKSPNDKQIYSEKNGVSDFCVLHPSLNPTGTNTLRWSHQNPNSSNISKKEGFNLRFSFGPAPGREWWSLDYENIELRIPAYLSQEDAMIELFEKPDNPPYFGSYHLMNASLIHPDLFWPLAEKKGEFKKKYAATWYQWTKNFGFAFQYGGGEATCDRSAHKKGAYQMVCGALKKLTKLNQQTIAYATKHGFVETIPDRTIGAKRGYPILCTRTEWGNIKPTVPLNYLVQSTAMWCTGKAMVRCQNHLDELNKKKQKDNDKYHIVMQVHDEMVFDFPKGKNGHKDNLPVIKMMKELMEKSGEDIGVPLKVAMTYNPVCWSEGESVDE